MPRLLKTGEVQLHMPRTGGRSLAREIGVIKRVGNIHDGPEEIPDKWKDCPTVATFRGPLDWNRSMANYLHSIHQKRPGLHYSNFLHCTPEDVAKHGVNPTFGLWGDESGIFKEYVLGHRFHSWYELYCSYFLTRVNRLVPISKLKKHVGNEY